MFLYYATGRSTVKTNRPVPNLHPRCQSRTERATSDVASGQMSATHTWPADPSAQPERVVQSISVPRGLLVNEGLDSLCRLPHRKPRDTRTTRDTYYELICDRGLRCTRLHRLVRASYFGVQSGTKHRRTHDTRESCVTVKPRK